jgi:hypothetical protein
MATFNKPDVTTAPRSTSARSVLATNSTTPDTHTALGGPGYTRTTRTELFLTCASSFITQKAFHETANDRVARVRALVRTVALEPGGLEWLLPFVGWLRGPGNMRVAPLVVAAETVRARVEARIDTKGGTGSPLTRRIVDAALARADEPGELLAYWNAHYGKPLPHALRNGIADAARRLYTEYSALKYDPSGPGRVRFHDVIRVCRVQPPADRATLWRYLIESRHPEWNKTAVPDGLTMITARAQLNAVPVQRRRELLGSKDLSAWMREAGVTWEWLSGWLADGKGMTEQAWRSALPGMGYMARLRNLANFDRSGMDDTVAEVIATQLADPAQVARSKQFPFRFFSAYQAAPSDRWRHWLSKALDASMANLPGLEGPTLVMVDTSGSMTSALSDNSDRSFIDVAGLFGIALAKRNAGNCDVHIFADSVARFELTPGMSTMRELLGLRSLIGCVGHGTQIGPSTAAAFCGRPGGYRRVVILSDMQTMTNYAGIPVTAVVPATVPIYSFNLNAYQADALPSGSGNRFALGGLTDSTFRLIPLIEAGLDGVWPWQLDSSAAGAGIDEEAEQD